MEQVYELLEDTTWSQDELLGGDIDILVQSTHAFELIAGLTAADGRMIHTDRKKSIDTYYYNIIMIKSLLEFSCQSDGFKGSDPILYAASVLLLLIWRIMDDEPLSFAE
jgi:hypothetical protein